MFGIVLAVCVAIIMAVMLFLLVVKVKVKVKAEVLKLASKTQSARESNYEDIRSHSLQPEITDTYLTENIAYGCTSKQSIAAATKL